jgi:hypothetical protein
MKRGEKRKEMIHSWTHLLFQPDSQPGTFKKFECSRSLFGKKKLVPRIRVDQHVHTMVDEDGTPNPRGKFYEINDDGKP